jgi:hypothetical protein
MRDTNPDALLRLATELLWFVAISQVDGLRTDPEMLDQLRMLEQRGRELDIPDLYSAVVRLQESKSGETPRERHN